MSAASQLMQAIQRTLKEDAAFTTLLGAGVIADRLMERRQLPAVIFSEIDSRDYSTDTDEGQEHFISLDIWSDGQSRKLSQELSALIRQLLVDARLDLGTGHHLVSIHCLDEKTGRDKGKAEQSIRLRFRAVSETIAEGDL